MADLDFQNFSTVHSKSQPLPATFVTAATITPITALTFITGTAATVATIVPPVSGFHMLVFVFSTGAVMNITGNILNAATAVSNVPVLLFYNPITGKYTAMV
jgi:hypothetical protein